MIELSSLTVFEKKNKDKRSHSGKIENVMNCLWLLNGFFGQKEICYSVKLDVATSNKFHTSFGKNYTLVVLGFWVKISPRKTITEQ